MICHTFTDTGQIIEQKWPSVPESFVQFKQNWRRSILIANRKWKIRSDSDALSIPDEVMTDPIKDAEVLNSSTRSVQNQPRF